MFTRGKVETYDGVALTVRGDTLSMLWQRPARLHRARWVYGIADRVVLDKPDGVLGLMIILPTSNPPDGPTRIENAVRLRALGPSIRRLATVAIGDDLWLSVVRSVMRAMAIVKGRSLDQVVTSTVEEGTTRLLELAGPATPSIAEIYEDVRALFDALGVDLRGLHRRDAPPRSLDHPA